MIRIRPLLLLAAIALLTTSLGCYTMVRQPGAEPEYSSSGAYGGYYDDSYDQYHHWMDLYYNTPYYARYTWDPWAGYPWWRDYYYCCPRPHDYYTDPVPVESGGRHAWERGPGSPLPPVGGGRVIPAPKVEPEKPSQPDSQPEPEKPERDKKPRKDEPRRHGWSR